MGLKSWHLFWREPLQIWTVQRELRRGMTLSAAPERWRANWDEIAKLYQMADSAGIEFILPIAKWRGLGGKADMWGRSFETFTHSAAAGAITKHIGVFVTAHAPITTPRLRSESHNHD